MSIYNILVKLTSLGAETVIIGFDLFCFPIA